jgi:hypothetical protein
MNSTTYPSCNAGINQELYLALLSQYCQLVPGWNGLSSNWNSALPGYEILDTGQIDKVSASDSAHFQANNPFTLLIILRWCFAETPKLRAIIGCTAAD